MRLSLEECRAAALRNNSDLQAELFEELARLEITSANGLRSLPHPILSAEFGTKGTQLWPYPNADDDWYTVYRRGTWRYFGELRWSPNEAALAALMAKGDCNDAAKARHMRIRTSQKIIGSLEGAFFRLLGLQECMPAAQRLTALRNEIAKETRDLKKDRLTDLDDFYRSEQKVSHTRLLANKLKNELERQRAVLAILMGLPPELCSVNDFQVTGNQTVPEFTVSTCDLEAQALRCRPEAVMEGLNVANSYNDTMKAVVKLFPKATGFIRYGLEDTRCSKNRDIKELGALIYVDLLEWAANYRETKAVQARYIKARHRSAAVALALVSDVRMAALRVTECKEDLLNCQDALQRTRKQVETAQAKEKLGVMERVVVQELRANALQEEIERSRLIGELNARIAELNMAMGSNYSEGGALNGVACAIQK